MLFILICSCTSGFIREEEARQRTNMSDAILSTFPYRYTISIFPFQNLTGDHDLDYLTNAVPDMLDSHLKPIENETFFLPFDKLNFKMTTNIVQLAELSNSIFSNYLILMPAVITQYNEQISTNGVTTVIMTNSITNSTNKIITNAPSLQSLLTAGQGQFIITTNLVTNIITNRTVSNIIETNLPRLVRDNYIYLLFNEFSALTNTICYLPIDLRRTNDRPVSNFISTNKTVISNTNLSGTNTNIISNASPNYYSEIRGRIRLVEKRIGPNVLRIDITVTNIVYKTNSFSLTTISREDRLPDKIFDFVKPLRTTYLNRESGDVLIDTQPEETSIYYDDTFIGKSPLYYPAIPAGMHRFSILKQGYSQVTLQADIIKDKTNFIYKSISHLETGGLVQIKSIPTNALVFIDSSYVGNTPLSLTDLTLQTTHRFSIETKSTNYVPFYGNFILQSTNQVYQVQAVLVGSQGTPDWEKRALWWGVYAGWGVTLFFIGENIYSDYERAYYSDLYYKNKTDDNLASMNYYDSINHSSTTWGVVSAMATLGLTGYALLNEEIYLGLELDPGRTAGAYFCLRF